MNKEICVSPIEMLRHENPYTKILIDNRPNDYKYAILSQHVYGGSKLEKGDCLPDDEKWKIHLARKLD